MAKNAPPAFQLYAATFLAETAAMTRSEVGAYILALAFVWRDGSLPAQPARLARFLRLTPDELEHEWPALEPHFELRDGAWVHPGLEQHRAERLAFIEEQVRRGIKSGQVRAASRARGNGTAPPNAGSTPVEPRLNHGSTTVQPRPVEPALNSVVCSLQTADKDSSSEDSGAGRGLRRGGPISPETTDPPKTPASIAEHPPKRRGRPAGTKKRPKNAQPSPPMRSDDSTHTEIPPAASDASESPAALPGEVSPNKPIQTVIWDEYEAKFLERHGQKPTALGRHFVQLAALIKKHGPDVVRSRLDVYFDSPPWKLRDGARDMDRFVRYFDELAPNVRAKEETQWFKPPKAEPAGARAANLAEEFRRLGFGTTQSGT